MIKPFLHERTKNKIEVFAHDKKQWAEAMLKEIDAEELPVYYGGKKTDPDGNEHCLTLVIAHVFPRRLNRNHQIYIK